LLAGKRMTRLLTFEKEYGIELRAISFDVVIAPTKCLAMHIFQAKDLVGH